LKVGTKVSEYCSNYYCRIPENLAFFISDDDNESRIEAVCAMRKKYLSHEKFKFEKKSFERLNLTFKHIFLPSQMKCIRVHNNSARSLDDIFIERVFEWEVIALSYDTPKDVDLLRDPAIVLQSFNLKIVLKRLTLRDSSSLIKFPFDLDPIAWYVNLNLLARSNASGVFFDEDLKVERRFEINILGLGMPDTHDKYIIITDTRELEGISCYREPFMSFHMYSSPFVINLWISIALAIIVLSVC